jgi:hypothetical protein
MASLMVDGSISVASLAQQCGARSDKAGQFRAPPNYAPQKSKARGAGLNGVGSVDPSKALQSSLQKVCKRESQLRARYYKSAAALPSSSVPTTTDGDGHDPHGGRVLESAAEALHPQLLSVFCGHELCPTEDAEAGADFGCAQTERCLCYLKATSSLPTTVAAAVNPPLQPSDQDQPDDTRHPSSSTYHLTDSAAIAASKNNNGLAAAAAAAAAADTAPPEHIWVHVFWHGAPVSSVVKRFASSFSQTQNRNDLDLNPDTTTTTADKKKKKKKKQPPAPLLLLSLIVWYQSPTNGLQDVKTLAESLEPFNEGIKRSRSRSRGGGVDYAAEAAASSSFSSSSSQSKRQKRRKKEGANNANATDTTFGMLSMNKGSLGCDLEDHLGSKRIHVCLLGPEQVRLCPRFVCVTLSNSKEGLSPSFFNTW